MKKKVLVIIWMACIVLLIVSCSKSAEQLIAERLELGQKYLLELNYEEAAAAFRKVIDLEPKHMDAYLGLAEAYVGMDDDAEALVVLETASQVISDGYDGTDNLFASAKEVLGRLAAMYIERGEQDKANGVAQLAEQFGIDIEIVEEDAALASQEPVTDEEFSDGGETEESTAKENDNQEDVWEYDGMLDENRAFEPIHYNGHTYQMFDDSLSWSDAEAQCEENGGHLVTIQSEEEQKFLMDVASFSSKMNMWIGAHMSDGKYVWVTGEDFSFENWAEGEPNNVFEMQYTAMMYTELADGENGTWNDEGENGRDWAGYYLTDFGYICEWDH